MIQIADTTTMAASPTPVLNNVSKSEYWTCDRTNGTSNVKVQLFWENAGQSGINNYTSDLVVARWNGAAWENAGQSAITASSPGDITSSTVTSFSPFTFGSLSSGLNPLPIELLDFNAQLENDIVQLKWETTTEINNDYFTIERSADGFDFETITQVKGAGNSSSNSNYSTIDPSPLTGISYYRLKQTDFNGDYTYSSIVSVTYNQDDYSFSIYPNPNKGDLINLSINGYEQNLKAVITNISGQTLYSEVLNSNQKTIKPSEKLSKGIYFISIIGDGVKLNQKLIVK